MLHWRSVHEAGSGIHFKARMVKFGIQVLTCDTLPQAKFCKNRWRGYTLFGKIYRPTNNYQFRRFWWP